MFWIWAHQPSMKWFPGLHVLITNLVEDPDSKIIGAYMGPTWGRQDPGGPHEHCYQGRYDCAGDGKVNSPLRGLTWNIFMCARSMKLKVRVTCHPWQLSSRGPLHKYSTNHLWHTYSPCDTSNLCDIYILTILPSTTRRVTDIIYIPDVHNISIIIGILQWRIWLSKTRINLSLL